MPIIKNKTIIIKHGVTICFKNLISLGHTRRKTVEHDKLNYINIIDKRT